MSRAKTPIRLDMEALELGQTKTYRPVELPDFWRAQSIAFHAGRAMSRKIVAHWTRRDKTLTIQRIK